MPTYEYACTECGDRLEVVQRFSDAPLTTCPACQGKLRKLFSPVGVVFKGSGFYKTDSRNGKPKTAAASSAGKDGDGSSQSTTSDKPPTTGSESSGNSNGAAKETAASTSSSTSSGSGGESTGGGSKVA